MTRIPLSKIVITALALGVLGSTAIYAQEKYSLKSPSGIAFSDFKGYEDWAVVSSARTDEVLKVIVANPTMIDAYKAGIPGNGQPSRMAPRRPFLNRLLSAAGIKMNLSTNEAQRARRLSAQAPERNR
jgi:hypothetical protein